MPQKIILDVDTGGDDAVAILLAGHHPALELMAVTVTHGNGPLATTLDNTLRVVQAGELTHVPVFAGADRPLVAEPLPTDPIQRATLPLPAPTLPPSRSGRSPTAPARAVDPRRSGRSPTAPARAVDFLVEYYLGPDGPETVYVPLGPQTNLALALRVEPRLAGRIPRIVTMAGAYTEGNTTPSAEFNVLADPEAAHIVFSAGIPLTMVGLEVTAQALVTLEDAERLRAAGTRWAQVAAGLIRSEVQWFIDHLGWSGGQIYDACAVAAVIEPAILQTRAMHVNIELRGDLTRGRTVADISGHHQKAPNVDVGVGIDRDRFIQILVEGLG
jgi:inosine-uridine nucleoside N-ribohydrolase